MRAGTLVRLALVAGWAALFGRHALHHLAPALGLDERHDVGAIIGEHLDQTLDYELRWVGGRARPLGAYQVSFARDEVRFRVEHVLRLDDLAPLAGPFARQLGGHGTSAELALSAIYDDRFRLAGVEGHATLAGRMAFSATYTGTMVGGGLDLAYRVADDAAERHMLIRGLGAEGAQAAMLVPTLPAELTVGERWTTPLIDPRGLLAGAGGGAPRVQAVLRVEDSETLLTAGGPLDLLRVLIEVDAQPQSTAWCDRRGTVYRLELAGTPLAAELVGIRGSEADQWPVKPVKPTKPGAAAAERAPTTADPPAPAPASAGAAP